MVTMIEGKWLEKYKKKILDAKVVTLGQPIEGEDEKVLNPLKRGPAQNIEEILKGIDSRDQKANEARERFLQRKQMKTK